MGRLFGTDGARGVANSEISCELAMQIGKAVAMVLTDHERRPKVLIGKYLSRRHERRLSSSTPRSIAACCCNNCLT